MRRNEREHYLQASLLVIFLAICLPAPAFNEEAEGEKPPAAKVLSVAWKILWHVKTGSMPKGVTLTPDQSEAWVTNFGHDRGHNISVYDAKDGKLKKQISFKGRAVELAFSPDGTRAYVSNFDTGRLMILDAKAYQQISSVKVGINPKIVTLSPSGDKIYVSNWSSNDVSVVDAASLMERGRIKVGQSPRGSALDGSGKILFVANFEGKSLSVADTETLKEIKKLPLASLPRHVTATPDGRAVLVSNMGANSLAVVNVESQAVDKWIKVGRGPKAVGVTPDSKLAATADYNGNTVSIVDLEKGEVIATIPELGKSPCGLALARDGKTLYVTSWYSNDLWAIELEIGANAQAPSEEKGDQ